MKSIFQFLPLAAFLAFALPTTSTQAADKAATTAPAKETKEKTIPFRGDVVSVSDKVVALKGAKGDRKYVLGPDSKVLNNSEEQKPASLAEVKAGSYVTGSYHKEADGTYLIHHLYVAPKKKEKEKEAASTATTGTTTGTTTSTDSTTTDKKKKKKPATDSSTSGTTTTTKSSQ